MALLVYHYRIPVEQVGRLSLRQAQALMDELPYVSGAAGSDVSERVVSHGADAGPADGGILLDGLYAAVADRMKAQAADGVK